MGKKMASVALFVGAFLIALAALSKFYMYDRLAVAPQNTTSTSISETAPGADAEYLDVANLEVVSGPLKSTRIVEGDVEKSKEASDDLGKPVDVWFTYSCTDTPDFECGSGKTPLSGTTDLVAFDANTGEAVDWKGSSSESGGEAPTEPANFEGLYFKFPFDTQKKTYKFWDGTLDQATDATYVGEGTVDGMKVYKFEQVIEPTKTGTIDVPGDLVGSDEDTVTADRIYSNVRTFSVEPTTGVIVVGGEAQDSYLQVDGERKLTTTQATLQYTDENTKSTVDEYRSKARMLGLVKTGVPVGGGIAGLVLVGVGLLGARRGKESSKGSSDDRELAHA